ncbi:histidine phosphatase family protein [Demequina litorisediminis]|uniref:Phosphoglycerate mutase n=1 Tax=Demequina litorisediminis TaxID=1849022 RepID=A0ABQ6I983_9MICO|nr:histidine phosphatase family protein [Demequina litorisediminis]GMA34359.1 hypothetical protein GCM10025876_05630 [Demequina litorisediminis]
MQVFLVRHGQTQWNVEGLLQGSSDIPLTALGRRQAESAAAALVGRVGDNPIIVASPLERARHTAHALADRLRVDVVVDDRLRERAYGVWEGVTPEERQRRWPDEVALWHAHGDPMLPGFEEHSAVQSRMIAGVEDWTDKAEEQGRTLVAFAHGSLHPRRTSRAASPSADPPHARQSGQHGLVAGSPAGSAAIGLSTATTSPQRRWR